MCVPWSDQSAALPSLPIGFPSCSSLTGDPQTQLCDALFTACKTGDVQTLQHLLGVPENGDLPEHSEDGQSVDMARSLLNQPVDEQGCTLLHVAAQAGRAEAVCLLLQAGADPALRYGCRVPSGSQPLLWESSDSLLSQPQETGATLVLGQPVLISVTQDVWGFYGRARS